jgi:hypothetical protein
MPKRSKAKLVLTLSAFFGRFRSPFVQSLTGGRLALAANTVNNLVAKTAERAGGLNR